MPICSVCGQNHSVNVKSCPSCGRKFTTKTQRCKAMTGSGAPSPRSSVRKTRGRGLIYVDDFDDDFDAPMPVPRRTVKRKKPAAKKSGSSVFAAHIGHIMSLQSHADTRRRY